MTKKRKRWFWWGDDAQLYFGGVAAMIGWIAGPAKLVEGEPQVALFWLLLPVAIYVFFGFFPVRRD